MQADRTSSLSYMATPAIAAPRTPTEAFRDAAAMENKQAPLHRWVPWIAGFSASFVEDVFDHYLGDVKEATVLDPFAGVGTTLVEAQLRQWRPIGFEINAYAALACRSKLAAADIDADALEDAITDYREQVGELERLIDQRALNGHRPRSKPPVGFKTRVPFYSKKVMPKVLFTLDYADGLSAELGELFRLAFASVMVSFSNYTYEPSLGSRPGAGKPLLADAPVVEPVAEKLDAMLQDIRWVADEPVSHDWAVHERSIMEALDVLEPESVDLLLTSPPYLNNYHYVRNTRPQMYWLGFASSPRDLRALEEGNFGKFWQVVREQDPIALDFDYPAVEDRLREIRKLRLDRGVYGGNGWANYAATYYNDTHRFLGIAARLLKPGGAAVIVVGNSLLQGVELKIEEHFGAIGEMHGLTCEDIHIVREKRVGSSIVNTGAREDSGKRVRLYDAATVLRKK
jgi:SAM-dependent methyltransferase